MVSLPNSNWVKFAGYFHFQSWDEQGDGIHSTGLHVLHDWLRRLQPQLLPAIGLPVDVLFVSGFRHHREQETRFTASWLAPLRTGRFQFPARRRTLSQRFARHGEASPLDRKRHVIHVFLNSFISHLHTVWFFVFFKMLVIKFVILHTFGKTSGF